MSSGRSELAQQGVDRAGRSHPQIHVGIVDPPMRSLQAAPLAPDHGYLGGLGRESVTGDRVRRGGGARAAGPG